MNEQEEKILADIRAAMKSPHVALHLVQTFNHGRGVQVMIKNRRVGHLLFPVEGQGLADVLAMLGNMADE